MQSVAIDGNCSTASRLAGTAEERSRLERTATKTEAITGLAEEAERSGEHDISLVLCALVLAIGEMADAELARYVALFTPPRPRVQRVSAA